MENYFRDIVLWTYICNFIINNEWIQMFLYFTFDVLYTLQENEKRLR